MIPTASVQKMQIFLERLGLTPNEARVIGVILERGQMRIAELARFAHVNRTDCYALVQRLLSKGVLCSEQTQKNRPVFISVNPDTLKRYAANQQKRIAQIRWDIENLLTLPARGLPHRAAPPLYYEELNGPSTAITIWERSLVENPTEGILEISTPNYYEDLGLTRTYNLEEYIPRRVARKIPCVVLGHPTAPYRELMPRNTCELRQMQFLHHTLEIPYNMLLFNETVAIHWREGRQHFGMIISDRHLAQVFRALFQGAWIATSMSNYTVQP